MAGYVRQSASEILAGQVVLATPLNAEFNQLQAAFHATTGHTHDASAGNGPKITLSTSVVGILPVANGGTGLVSVDNTVPRYNGTTGILQTSDVIITDAGNLIAGVGTLSTTATAQLIAVGATVSGLLLENTDNTGSGYITFGDGAIAGRIQYNHSTNAMTFITNATLAATLSSAGALTLVGGLSATTGTFSDDVSIAGSNLDFTGGAGGGITYAAANNTLSFRTQDIDQVTINADGLVTLVEGQIKFPSTANPSSDANVLDDYEEGIWTPEIDFVTTGNLVVTYEIQNGTYTKIGRQVTLNFEIDTATFTHTTASDILYIKGMPFSATSGVPAIGTLQWQGITKANYTHVYPILSSSSATRMLIAASGSGQLSSSVTATNVPSGGSVILAGTITYFV